MIMNVGCLIGSYHPASLDPKPFADRDHSGFDLTGPFATAAPRPAPTPATVAKGPVVNIPGSKYGVMELRNLDPPECCPAMAPDGERVAFSTCRTMAQKVYVQKCGRQRP